jgi:hypothetical protein
MLLHNQCHSQKEPDCGILFFMLLAIPRMNLLTTNMAVIKSQLLDAGHNCDPFGTVEAAGQTDPSDSRNVLRRRDEDSWTHGCVDEKCVSKSLRS